MKDFFEFRKDLMEALRDKMFRKEYVQAQAMYRQFLKRGDKPANALHKAASSFKHVTDRGLKDFMNKSSAAKRMA